MKSASSGLNDHLQQEVTTLATCWRVSRRDGQTFYFTDHDIDLTIDLADGNGDQTYLASSSYNRSAIRNDDSLAVDNLDLTGVLDSSAIDETELRRGLFDYAEVIIFIVNYVDLSQGILRMRRGRLGEVTLSNNGFFLAELRGLTQSYSRKIVELYQPECRTDLGSPLCKIPILPEIAIRLKSYQVGDFVRAASELEGLSDVTVLVHGDSDADDVSENEAVATLGSQAVVQTAIKQLGSGSIEFSPSGGQNPSNSFVEYPDLDAYTLGTSQFNIECFVRFKDLTQTRQIIASQYLNTGNQRGWYLARNGTDLEFVFYTTGGITANSIVRPFSWSIDTWYHVAVSRDSGNDIRLFVDGSQIGAVLNSSIDIHNSTAPLRLGKLLSSGFTDDPLNGFVDEFRMLVGAAIYTGAYTPPITPFQTPPEAIAALSCLAFDDRIYRCSVAGISAAAQPVYDTTLTNTTVDGTASFVAEEAWTRCIELVAVDVSNPRKKFTVTELTPNSGGATPGRDFFPDDSMNGGVVVFETGANAGVAMELRDFAGDDGITIEQEIELFLDLPFDLAIGDTGRIYRGCFKRLLGDCRDIFDNVQNFRGEPYVPGQDELLSYPDAKS